ncbi:S8 family serine peptidase [Marivita cryptomonadis]|uniref:S8 family serine peptidase n=1 Tax=Marivita cryptomonadis TaxID=505252 RepID=UPI000A1DDB09|nr:S8 family serine peptidase [Marivita cryptomonadis]
MFDSVGTGGLAAYMSFREWSWNNILILIGLETEARLAEISTSDEDNRLDLQVETAHPVTPDELENLVALIGAKLIQDPIESESSRIDGGVVYALSITSNNTPVHIEAVLLEIPDVVTVWLNEIVATTEPVPLVPNTVPWSPQNVPIMAKLEFSEIGDLMAEGSSKLSPLVNMADPETIFGPLLSAQVAEFEAVLDVTPNMVMGGTLAFGGPVNGNRGTRPVEGIEQPSGEAAYVAGQLLVQFSGKASDTGKLQALKAIGGQIEEVINETAGPYGTGGQLVLISFDASLPIDRVIENLLRDATVETAGRNWFYQSEAFVSDDRYYTDGSLWGMYGDTTSPANQYGSQAGEAWAAGYGGSMSTVVGVIDTGMDPTHPDLYLNIWLNQMEIPLALRDVLKDTDLDGLITFRDLNHADNSSHVSDLNNNNRIDAFDLLDDTVWTDGVDTSGNGYIDDLVGWNFWDNNNQPYLASDGDEHGTHVAGTIGGLGGNGAGVVGVNWDVQLMPLKFLGPSGGYTSGAIAAVDYYTWYAKNDTTLDYAATNNSWGGGGFSTALRDAIVRGGLEDVLFVAAAGNSGNDADASPSYPAAYTTIEFLGYEAVLSVAAINSSGGLASFSNYGDVSVDLGAPGVSVWSTLPGGYGSYSGTSMASPHVAGAIALYAAAFPTATAAEIRDILLGSVTETGALLGKTVTGGRLDINTMMNGMADAPVYVLGMVVNDSVIAGGEMLEVTISFSKGVTFDQTGLTYDAGSLDFFSLTSNGDGTTWVATFTPAAAVTSSSQTVGVKPGSYTATDGSLSDAPAATSGEFTVDTVAPGTPIISMVVNDANGDGNLTTGESATVTITFTEAVTNFEIADISLTNATGALTELQSVDGGTTWTVTFTPDSGQSGEFSVTVAESYTDVAGNPGTAGTSTNFALNTTGSTPGMNVYGTDGSESVFGGDGDDIISGLPENTAFNGAGTIDFLYGYGGVDTFILGNASAGIFYDDGNDNSGNTGTNDYVHIKDFGVGGADKVKLIGGDGQYLLAEWTMDGVAGTVIAKDGSGRNFGSFDSKDEIIAFLEGVTPGDLSKTTDETGTFTFVTFAGGPDMIAPVVTVEGLTTSDTTPALSGTVDDFTASILVAINGSSYAATNSGNGTWTLADNTIMEIADGTYDVVVTATDGAGNSATDSTTADLVIDTTAPVVTVDTLTTSDTTPQLTGTVTGTTAPISVAVNGSSYTATNNGNGTWTLVDDAITSALAPGTYDVSVRVTDEAGNVGQDTSADELIITDSAGPVVTVDALTTSDTTPALSGKVDDTAALISVAINGSIYTATNNGDGTWMLVEGAIATGLADGTYDVVVTATDGAGNSATDNTAGELIIDTTLPVVTVAALSTPDTTPTLTGMVTDTTTATVSVAVGTQTFENVSVDAFGNWSVTVSTALTPGTYDVSATATDAAGNSATDQTISELIIEEFLGQIIFGTTGSDVLSGGSGNDIISGLPDPAETPTTTTLGEGEVDTLTGGGGEDVFELGDSRGIFYDDDNPRSGNNGKNDYALITDFMIGVDKIQLSLTGAGTSIFDEYFLVAWTQSGVTGTGIFHDTDGAGRFDSKDEMIGLVEAVGVSDFTDTDFVVV